MPLRSTLLSVGTFAALAATSFVGGRHVPAAVAAEHAAPTTSAPAVSRIAVDDAIGTAVIESISRQFDTADVVVQLAEVRVRPASIQDREISGAGKLRIGGAGAWIPFTFEGMFDTASTEVTWPRLQLGGGARTATDAPLATSLDRQVRQALKAEFQSQPVAWTAGDVHSTDLGRFVQVDGAGRVDFGADGATAAQVHGLYDRDTGRWLRVRYELGDEAAPTAALASL